MAKIEARGWGIGSLSYVEAARHARVCSCTHAHRYISVTVHVGADTV